MLSIGPLNNVPKPILLVRSEQWPHLSQIPLVLRNFALNSRTISGFR